MKSLLLDLLIAVITVAFVVFVAIVAADGLAQVAPLLGGALTGAGA